MMGPDRLRGKVCLISGAASGIARATALRFAQEGARLALVDLNAEGLNEIHREAAAQGVQVETFAGDISGEAVVRAAVGYFIEKYGRLDCVFNAVGISGRRFGDGPAHEATLDGWNTVMSINATSMFLMCKYTIPHLLETQGAIVNLSSVLGIVGGGMDFSTVAYAASKGAIISMSRSMAAYYAPQGLRVNVVAPGLIATAMSKRAQTDAHILESIKTRQPLTGALGEPEDIAAAVAYLASEDARFVTGAVLTVDGGWTMQ